jgi:hypothetical protein
VHVFRLKSFHTQFDHKLIIYFLVLVILTCYSSLSAFFFSFLFFFVLCWGLRDIYMLCYSVFFSSMKVNTREEKNLTVSHQFYDSLKKMALVETRFFSSANYTSKIEGQMHQNYM